MLVQHGVRHLLLADDPAHDGQNSLLPLLDTSHPFPSLPPQKRTATFDPTPIRTTISVSAGQIVAICSLDRSIRLHNFQLTVKPTTATAPQNSDQIWFDIANVDSSTVAAKWVQSANDSDSENGDFVSQAPIVDLSSVSQLPELETARRFHLPFFRQGNVYERTLITQLILHDDRITIYGDATNPQHSKVAEEILQCGISKVLKVVSQSIGPIADLDADGRLALVLGQLADPIPAQNNQEPIRGCVRPADFQARSPGSVDVIYLDPKHLLIDELQGLLAHEFAHAATFSLLVESGQTPTAMPGWLNEAIAHHIEQQIAPHSNNLLQRRRLFDAKTWLYPSAIPDEFTGMELRRGPSRIASMELLQSTFAQQTDPKLRTLITSRGDGINRLLVANQTNVPNLFRGLSQHLAQRRISPQQSENTHDRATDGQQPAFDLTRSSDQSIQLRGTSVAISSPAATDCELVIATTRDALPQITVIELPQPN